MARAPKFNDPRYAPPASGWKVAHRSPDSVTGMFGNLDGIALGSGSYESVSKDEQNLNDYAGLRNAHSSADHGPDRTTQVDRYRSR